MPLVLGCLHPAPPGRFVIFSTGQHWAGKKPGEGKKKAGKDRDAQMPAYNHRLEAEASRRTNKQKDTDKHNETLREGGRQRKAETETEKGGETDRDR